MTAHDLEEALRRNADPLIAVSGGGKSTPTIVDASDVVLKTYDMLRVLLQHEADKSSMEKTTQ